LLGFDHFAGEIRDGELHIGQTAVPIYNPENKTKVPDVLFYENQQVRTGRILFHLESAYGQKLFYRNKITQYECVADYSSGMSRCFGTLCVSFEIEEWYIKAENWTPV